MDATTTAYALSLCPDVDGGQTPFAATRPGTTSEISTRARGNREDEAFGCLRCFLRHFLMPDAPRFASVRARPTPSRPSLRTR